MLNIAHYLDDEAKNSEIAIVLFLLILGFISIFIVGRIPGSEDASDILGILSVLYFGSGFLTYTGFIKWRELRLIRNTPTSTIRSMPMGTVEVKGVAEQGPENVILESPFSGKECLFYRYQIEEYRSSGKNSHWVTIDQGYEGVRFVIDDGTDEVIIDPEGAELEIPMDNSYRVNSEEGETEQIRDFMNEKGIAGPGGFIGDNDRKYNEWFVSPGEEIYVFGYASNERDRHGEYPIIKDDDRAEMFMISDKSEKELVNDKKWTSRAMMFGGAAAVLLLYALLLGYAGAL